MEYKGYAGAGLWVDLSTGDIRKEELDPELVRRFVGGWGFTNKLAYDLIGPEVDPLSPENVIVIGAGALSGTLAPGSTRVAATTKQPINGAIGTANAGGFSHQLKGAGYDYVVIRGRAEKPVNLKIMDDDVGLEDAEELWGKDTLQTTDLLRAKHGANSSVIAIGQAGERLVKISFAIVDKFGTLGKGGFGAVFGSKNLKALVAGGTKGLALHDAQMFIEKTGSVRQNMLRYPFRKEWIKLGPGLMNRVYGRVITQRNWTTPLASDPILNQDLLNIFQKGHACPTCPLSCRALVKIEGEETGESMSPFSTFIAAAPLENSFLLTVHHSARLADLCNRYGLDRYSLNFLMGYVTDLYQKEIITQKDTDGLELNWDSQTAEILVDMIGNRQGLGDTLADGLIPTARRFGKAAEEHLVAIKGQEPWWDPRGNFGGWDLSSCLNPRGSYLATGMTPALIPGRTVEQIAHYCLRLKVPEEAIKRICFSDSEFNMARLIKYAEDWYSVYSCLGVCIRQPVMLSYAPETAAELYTAATGIPMDYEALHGLGERVWKLTKTANVRQGFSRKDDRFPDRFFEPLKAEGKEIRLMDYYRKRELTRQDVEKMLDDYYDERGWDIAKGIPTRAKLTELCLEDIVS